MKPASSPGIAHILNHLSADCTFQTPPLGTAVHRHVPTAVQKRLDEVVNAPREILVIQEEQAELVSLLYWDDPRIPHVVLHGIFASLFITSLALIGVPAGVSCSWLSDNSSVQLAC